MSSICRVPGKHIIWGPVRIKAKESSCALCEGHFSFVASQPLKKFGKHAYVCCMKGDFVVVVGGSSIDAGQTERKHRET